jgi:hypothetical protein
MHKRLRSAPLGRDYFTPISNSGPATVVSVFESQFFGDWHRSSGARVNELAQKNGDDHEQCPECDQDCDAVRSFIHAVILAGLESRPSGEWTALLRRPWGSPDSAFGGQIMQRDRKVAGRAVSLVAARSSSSVCGKPREFIRLLRGPR